jgi:hypothetical protein
LSWCGDGIIFFYKKREKTLNAGTMAINYHIEVNFEALLTLMALKDKSQLHASLFVISLIESECGRNENNFWLALS